MINRRTLTTFAQRSLKLPLILFTAGLFLLMFTVADNEFIPDRYRNILKLFDKLSLVLIVLGILSCIYKVITGLMKLYENKFFHTHKISTLIVNNIRKGLRVIFILMSLDISITLLSTNRLYLIFANHTVDIFMIGAISWITIRVLHTMEAVYYQYVSNLPANEHKKGKALYTKIHIFRNVATVLIVLITLAAILMSFSSVRNIGISLLASAGFLTAIIGLSAQRTLFTIFSGIQIAFSQIIKIGDLVLINQESGLIEEITFTFVTLKLGDRRRLIVPITHFIEKPFENWSRDEECIRSSLLFYVDYRMPIEPLREALDQILNTSPFWDKNAKKLQVTNLKERTVEIRIQVSAKNAEDLSDLKADVREKMLNFIRMTYPQFLPRIQHLESNEVMYTMQ